MSDDQEKVPQLSEVEISWRRMQAALAEIGSCLTDMSTILLKGQAADTAAMRGNVALGLERAAAYVRGQASSRQADKTGL